MREQGLGHDGVRFLGGESCPKQERATNYLDWPSLQKRRENRCINEILTTDGKLSLDPLVGEKGKKTLKEYFIWVYHTESTCSEDTELRDIQLNYLTEDDRKELKKFSHLKLKQQSTVYPRVNLWVQMVAQQNFSKHLER